MRETTTLGPFSSCGVHRGLDDGSLDGGGRNEGGSSGRGSGGVNASQLLKRRVVPRVDDVPPCDEVVKDGHQGGQCIKYQRDTIHEGLP
ncbi:hypothetical protein V1478_016258 [Vespula squamosa]|uniref:Uncharacterized protein n=1 Tax=Vespula squamosa TaxID=30214 RepID=A0ABD1ZZA4_VESSQ